MRYHMRNARWVCMIAHNLRLCIRLMRPPSEGIWSTTFLIFNRLIGTGYASLLALCNTQSDALPKYRIFATPSVILRASGSVGFSLVMWLLGALFAVAGTAVYVELGTVHPTLYIQVEQTSESHVLQGLPRSGGEKIYLEYFFRRPKFLITCIVSAYFVINVSTSVYSSRSFSA